MHIQQEGLDSHTIRSYSESSITVGDNQYEQSIILNHTSIICPWAIHALQDLNDVTIEPFLSLEPEIIIIGHQSLHTLPPPTIMQYLSKKRIGIECMSIGAACRTFNVLLSELRKVAIGIIF